MRFSIGKKTQKINKQMWFFNVGLSGKNGMVNNMEMKTMETMLKDNKHTKARLLACTLMILGLAILLKLFCPYTRVDQ